MQNRPTEKRIRLRRTGINLLLCVSSISIFFGGAEALARLQYTPQKFEPYGIFEYDKEKLFQLKKNQFSMFHDVPFTTNSFGFRSAELSLQKPENTKRILLLGDSITFGHGVHDKETYTSLLEESLNRQLSEKEKPITVEVINTAAPMNSPYQEYYDLKRGMQFDPDLIVLQFTLNDVYDMPIIDVIDLQKHMDYVFGQRSALYLFMKDMYGRIRFRDFTGEKIAEKAQKKEILDIAKLIVDPQDPEVQKAWNDALWWILQMISIAKEKNIPFVILATPFDFQLGLEEAHAHPQRTLQTFAEEQGIYFIDLLEILQEMLASHERGDKENTKSTAEIIAETNRDSPETIRAFWDEFFIDYDHPSPKGHRLIASMLHSYITEMLPSVLQR